MKKTKVVFFLPNLHGGGAERVSITMLRKLDKSKFDITLVLVKKVGDFIELVPSNVNIIDLNLQKTIFSYFKFRNIIQKIQPDIVFSTLIRTHNVLYLALYGIQNKPKIILRSPNSPKLLLENNQLGRWSRFLLEKAYKRANLILAQTPEM